MYDKSSGQIIEYHHSMLADTVRTKRYQEAISQTVGKGDVVVDLGCGMGILSLFACRAGASRVYAVEMGPVIEVAKAVIRQNGFQDQVVFLHDRSDRINLPEQVDVILTETIGNFGLEEGILGAVIDARSRFLKDDGRIIPLSLELFAVPVELPDVYERRSLWTSMLYGLDFSTVRTLAVNNPDWVDLPPEACLCEPARLHHVESASVDKPAVRCHAHFRVTRRGMLHGIAGWFAAELASGVFLTNAPPSEAPNWRQAFFPLEHPVHLEEGDEVQLDLWAAGNGRLWRWKVRCMRHGAGQGSLVEIAAFDQSSLFGEIASPEALKRREPAYVPQLSDKGKAARFILQAMDGAMPVGEIARQAREAFPALFADEQAAEEQVRALSQKYSR